jgi:amidohydrolase family protein
MKGTHFGLRRMLRVVRFSLSILGLILSGASTQSIAQPEQMVAVIGGTLIDGNGGPPIPDSVVLIKGNKIAQMGTKTTVKFPKATKIVDATGKFVLPGLIDMHVHYHDWMGELFLANGVTTVKDLGNDLQWIADVSAAVEQGRIRGPRIFYVGDGLDTPPPARETHVAVENELQAKRAVDLLREKGASAIKVREKITPELLKAIVEEAHKLGIPVTGHLRSIDAREAADAGIDGLEHASGIVQALTDYPRRLTTTPNELQMFINDIKSFSKIDPVKAEQLAKYLAGKKVALIPTMSSWWRMATERRDDFAREDADYSRNPQLAYVPEDVKKMWATSFVYKLKSADDLAEMRVGYKKIQDLLKAFYKAGGKIVAGSDTFLSVPGLSLQREMVFLVDAGFTPMQAITIATRDNAEFLGKGKELGTIKAGKRADLVVVGANPLEDIRNAQRVTAVIKDGQVIDVSYHPNYSIPIPTPTITRPVWLERELEKLEKSKATNR